MTRPLILALPFIEGETLTGYVSRNAKRHETTPRDFCSDLGMRWPSLCSGHDAQIERLSWLTGEPLEMLRKWRTKKIKIGHYKLGSAYASTAILRRTAIRLCPQCVTSALTEAGPEGVFQMLEWSVLSINRCMRHGCPLMSLPSAQHSHTTYDFVGRVLEHRTTIQQASHEFEALPESRFETYVRTRIWSGPQQGDWLSDLDLTLIHRACLTLGAALQGYKGEMPGDLPMPETRSLCELGFQNLVNSKATFRTTLHKLHNASTTERPYYSADLGPFYHWLREVHADLSLAELVQVVQDHVFETYPTPTDKKVFGRKPDTQNWLTIDDARKRAGFGAVFLKQLLGHMEGISEVEALKRTDVHVDEIKKVRSYWQSLSRLGQAASDLGLLPAQIKSLQNLGVLSTVKVTSSQRYLKRKEIDDLLNRVTDLPDSLPGKSVLPIKEFCRAKGVHLTRVIDLWIQGKLDGKICRGEGCGLHAIEVDWDALCGKAGIRLDRDLKLAEAASYLQISVISIRHLRDHGFLTQVEYRNPDTNHLRSYISKKSIQEFERTYITLGQMASRQEVASIHLARQLDRDDIHPIICGKEFVRVYKKSMIGWWEKRNV